MTKGGTVDQPMARPQNDIDGSSPNGKPAVTHYRIMENFRNYTRLRYV